MDGFRIPDVIGELVGYKRLNVLKPEAPFTRLISSYGFGDPTANIWPTNRWFVGQCPRGHTDVPHESCSCGIYSANTLEALFADTGYPAWDSPVGPVVVRIGLAGKVIPGSLGYIAEKARITAIYVPLTRHALGEKLARLYSAELVCSDEWVKHGDRHLRAGR